jgi:hypothetical protein
VPADPGATARAIIDACRYMTIATADGAGRPWATPVWYAHAGYIEFVWVSAPDVRHSRNIGERAEVGIVIFDSTVAPGSGQAVYFDATAERLTGDAIDAAIAVFSRRSVEQGLGAWTRADVAAPARLRPYRAVATAFYVLGARDERIVASPLAWPAGHRAGNSGRSPARPPGDTDARSSRRARANRRA